MVRKTVKEELPTQELAELELIMKLMVEHKIERVEYKGIVLVKSLHQIVDEPYRQQNDGTEIN